MMPEVSCYTAHLYCDCVSADNYGGDCPNDGYMEYPHEFSGATKNEYRKAARVKGWVFKRDGRVIAPKCNKSTK